MSRQNKPGKKVGTLRVKLDRVTGRSNGVLRYQEKAHFDVELRLDSKGTFHAAHGGRWFSAKTQLELHDLVKGSFDSTVDVTWERYLVVDYTATAKPLITGSSRTESCWSDNYSIKDDRQKLKGDPTTDRRSRSPHAITGISLEWEVVDYSSPYHPPEEPEKTVRMKRELGTHKVRNDEGDDTDVYELVPYDPREMDNDALPKGAVVWTAEREALLVGIRDALGKLDAKLVALFRGEPDELASKIDRAHGAAGILHLTERGDLT